MPSKPVILFVGNYLSQKKGTTALAVRLSQKLKNQYTFVLASNKQNKVLRMLEIIWYTITSRSNKIIVDVFSGTAFYIALIAANTTHIFTKKKIIFIIRGGNMVQFHKDNPEKVNQVLRMTNVLFTPSKYLQQYFQQQGFEISLLENFVDLSLFTYKKETANKHKLLWVRAFKHIYNPLIPIYCIAALREKKIPVTLTMIGPDDGMLAQCQNLANELGVNEFIYFVGAVAQQELPSYYQSHGIYLNTTSYESFGNALMEASSCGLPSVSSNVGEIPHIWTHNENMLLVPSITPEEFTKAIQLYVEDDNLYQRISSAAHKNSQNYAWENVEAKWIKILDR